jgi:hypothetical protein
MAQPKRNKADICFKNINKLSSINYEDGIAFGIFMASLDEWQEKALIGVHFQSTCTSTPF